MTLSYREEKLKRIRKRWFDEPLGVAFPFLSDVGLGSVTCAEFVESGRFPSHDDWELNLSLYGVADPHAAVAALREVFEAAGVSEINPTKVKDAAIVLDVFRKQALDSGGDREPASPGYDEFINGSLKAEAQAAEMCLSVLAELAHEFGFALPVKQSGRKL